MNVVRHEGQPPARFVVSLTPAEARGLLADLDRVWVPGDQSYAADLRDLLHNRLREASA